MRKMYSRVSAKSLALFALAVLLSVEANGQDPIGDNFGKSYALIVGINEYISDDWPDLSYATRDAEGIAAFSEGQGFDEVVLLLDEQATRSEIAYYLQDYFPERLREADRLFFFFAGHGHTDSRGGTAFGYIVPTDGTGRTSSYISMQEIRGYSQRLGGARHQLFIFDSCYGGLVGTRGTAAVSSSIPQYMERITSRPARQYITAGGAGEAVLDGGPEGHSYFTSYLLEGVQKGYADLNGDSIITFSELSAFLVPRATNEYQTPTHGDLPGHGLGEFVFRGPGQPDELPTDGGNARPEPPAKGTDDGALVLSVWKVGSPHSGSLPAGNVPSGIRKRASRLGLELDVTRVAPADFFDEYVRAFGANEAPDILVIDNFGHLRGITTDIGRFEGIYSHPGVQDNVVFVTETLSDFGDGWQLLSRASPNHEFALTLAMREPECIGGCLSEAAAEESSALGDYLQNIAFAYFSCDQDAFLEVADPASLDGGCADPPAVVRNLAISKPSGNANLSFVGIEALIQGERVGISTLLAVVRRDEAGEWRLLTLTNDPMSTALIPALLDERLEPAFTSGQAEDVRAAELLTADGEFPQAEGSARFGDFIWRRPAGENIVLEVAEFNYDRASRLFLDTDPGPGEARLSTGKLWSTRGPWQWRIWTVGRDGRIAFSAARGFVH